MTNEEAIMYSLFKLADEAMRRAREEADRKNGKQFQADDATPPEVIRLPQKLTPNTDQLVYQRFVYVQLKQIWDKIKVKGEQYTKNGNVLDAVTETAGRMVGGIPSTQDTLSVILSFMDKHFLALMRHGDELPDAQDRLSDIIIYCLMAMYLLNNADEPDYDEVSDEDAAYLADDELGRN